MTSEQARTKQLPEKKTGCSQKESSQSINQSERSFKRLWATTPTRDIIRAESSSFNNYARVGADHGDNPSCNRLQWPNTDRTSHCRCLQHNRRFDRSMDAMAGEQMKYTYKHLTTTEHETGVDWTALILDGWAHPICEVRHDHTRSTNTYNIIEPGKFSLMTKDIADLDEFVDQLWQRQLEENHGFAEVDL
jgi:hypothetical protein